LMSFFFADQYENLHQKLTANGISSLSLKEVRKEIDKLPIPKLQFSSSPLNMASTPLLGLLKCKLESTVWKQKIAPLTLKEPLDVLDFKNYSQVSELILVRHSTDGMKCSRQGELFFDYHLLISLGVEVDSVTIMNVGPEHFNSPKFGDILTLALGDKKIPKREFFLNMLQSQMKEFEQIQHESFVFNK